MHERHSVDNFTLLSLCTCCLILLRMTCCEEPYIKYPHMTNLLFPHSSTISSHLASLSPPLCDACTPQDYQVLEIYKIHNFSRRCVTYVCGLFYRMQFMNL